LVGGFEGDGGVPCRPTVRMKMLVLHAPEKNSVLETGVHPGAPKRRALGRFFKPWLFILSGAKDPSTTPRPAWFTLVLREAALGFAA